MSPIPKWKEPDLRLEGVRYQNEGFAFGPRVLSPELIRRVNDGMDGVRAGEYETGRAPLDPFWGDDKDPEIHLRKINQAHFANRAIYEALSSAELGRAVAALTGAKMVQVWATQLLHKPGGPAAVGQVGWHQDYQYWQTWFTPDSEIFTAWLALSDIEEDSGPMCFVPGSHQWGLIPEGDFHGAADARAQAKILPPGQTWQEVSALMPAGAFSLHHRLTVHGSHPNRLTTARRSFAIHLRTENSTPTPEKVDYYHNYVSFLDDLQDCPVIYQA